MAKNPFDSIPEIREDVHAGEHEPRNVTDSEELSKNAPPRTLVSNLSKYAVPLLGVAIVIWLFLPDTGKTKRKVDKVEVQVDQSRQVSETSALLEKLKTDAIVSEETAKKAVDIANAKSVNVSVNNVNGQPNRTPMPTPFSQRNTNGISPAQPNFATSESEQKELAAQAKHEEEVRSSGLEVNGTIKLMGENEHQVKGTQKLDSLQDELQNIAKKRDAAVFSQQDEQNRLLASLNQKPAKSKGVDQDFLEAQSTNANNQNRVVKQQNAASTSILFQGTPIRAILMSGVSSDLPGTVLAQVTSDVYDSIYGHHVLIPKGSKLVGVYSSEIVVGQDSLLMAMNRLILPNGTWISLSGASAANMLGQSGVNADVNNHFFKMFSTSFILGATALLLPKSQSTVTSTNNNNGTSTTGSVTALALNDALRNVMERNKNMHPTLTVLPGQEFLFMVSQDMVMIPYRP